MSIEQNLKTLLGEYTFQICVLQEQLAQANAKIIELEGSQVKVSSNNQTGGVTAAKVNK